MEKWGNVIELRAVAECLTDAKKARVSAENRARRGGVGDQFDVDLITGPARVLEETYEKMLLDRYREVVPAHVQKWAAQIPGLATGELFPRMIGLIGHPRIATPYRRDRDDKGKVILVPDGDPYPRTVKQLQQYCGCGDSRTRPVAMVLGHSPSQAELLRGGKRTVVLPLLRTFADYLVRSHTRSEAVADSVYYGVYLMAKADAAGNVHEYTCQNKKRPPFKPDGCGTVLHPEWGAPGSSWRPGHIDAHGRRLVGKRLLKDLWIACGEWEQLPVVS